MLWYNVYWRNKLRIRCLLEKPSFCWEAVKRERPLYWLISSLQKRMCCGFQAMMWTCKAWWKQWLRNGWKHYWATGKSWSLMRHSASKTLGFAWKSSPIKWTMCNWLQRAVRLSSWPIDWMSHSLGANGNTNSTRSRLERWWLTTACSSKNVSLRTGWFMAIIPKW